MISTCAVADNRTSRAQYHSDQGVDGGGGRSGDVAVPADVALQRPSTAYEGPSVF